MGKYRAEVGGREAVKPLQDSNSTGFGRRCQAAGGSNLGARLAETVDQVQDGQDRVGKEHARAGIAHHRPDLIPFSSRIAVDRAFTAGGFVFLERTMVQPFSGVGEEFSALLAWCCLTAMVIPAEAVDHSLHGPGFTLQAS